MILFANDETSYEVRKMWKVCFNDTEEFMDLYFTGKYKNENTLVYFVDGKIAASLQMLPYFFTFYGVEIPVSYISGACTLPEYRGRGYMGKLLLASFEVMRQREIPLSILIPAEEWLYDYYYKYGYVKVFDEDKDNIPIKEILDKTNGNISRAYADFNKIYRNKDFCVQKSESDFEIIIKDAEMDGFPVKTNLSGMARIIDSEALLSLYAEKNSDKSLIFDIKDDFLADNNKFYEIKNGFCYVADNSNETIDINTLCRLLLGYRTDELPENFSKRFDLHKPIMNLMLE